MINLYDKVALIYKKRILVTKGEEKFKGLGSQKSKIRKLV